MPDEQGRLTEGDLVWVEYDEDFQTQCEAVVTHVLLEDCGDGVYDCYEIWIASDPLLPQGTYENRRFHALYGRDTWELRNPHIQLLGTKTVESRLVGSAKFWRKVEENV